MKQRSPNSQTPRALDRTLTMPILDATYRIAQLDASHPDRSAHLTIALREYTTEENASNKLKKTVTRIWINPPEGATPMIRWAIDHPDEFPDRRLMHLGSLLATTPFVGSVLAIIGRANTLGEAVTVPILRRRLTERWGASSTVESGAGKVITTLRRLGAVTGGGREPIEVAEALAATPVNSAWLVHALLLGRDASDIDTRDVPTAPELFWAELEQPASSYPHLREHREGVKRRVWSLS
ncbi:MAG: hypothetical protein WD079_00255 [Phycisphaeraceae bacterium]